MAVTGFWPVFKNLRATLDYADNPDKTTLPEYLDEDLYAALRYAENDDKTDLKMFAGGINCSAQNAYAEMIAVQRRFGLRGKVVGYHGIQSFREGEVTPEQAFAIGKETARRMWGDRYQVLVTVHLNTDNVHCHFVVNPVSFKDGAKFQNKIGDHKELRKISDEICREHDVTISLGDACRPGCLADASDVCQIEELVRLGELTKRAWARDVQVMVEGPGHMPMDQIAANMKIQQTICMGAPFYVLGPLVTDIAPGYDHITSAIGGAIAAQNGAAFLCYVTPAEHLALPNVEDVKQGIIASKIAAHAADIAKGVRGAREIDDKMADARRVLDWDAQWECAIDPETAKQIREDRKPEHEDTCSMCGKFCAVRSMNKALAGEYIDIL